MPEHPGPLPLPDELIDSYIIRAESLGGYKTKALDSLSRNRLLRLNPFVRAGGSDTVWNSPLFDGFCDSQKVNLSMLRLFLPKAENEERPRSWFLKSHADAEELRPSLAHCVLCTQIDIAERGYSYWRRQPQVRCNQYCSKHGFMIVDACSVCGVPLRNDQLPETHCAVCESSLIPDSGSTRRTATEKLIFQRISVATDYLLSDLRSGHFDITPILKTTELSVPSRTPGYFNNVARFICNRIARDRLRQLTLDPFERPTFGWPSVYLSGHWPRKSPNLELFLYGVFGDVSDADQYWKLPMLDERKLFSGQPHLLDIDVLRRLYKASSWADGYSQQDKCSNQIRRMIAPYPGLKQRIEAFRRRRNIQFATS